MTIGEFIQQNPQIAVSVVVAICTFLGTAGLVWRNRSATNNKIRLQQADMATLRAQMAANEAKNKLEREAQEARQKAELEAESERQRNRMQREIKTLYEKRLDDYHVQITELENQRKTDKADIDELRSRLEKMVADLTEQRLLLQAEKRAYAELETFNGDLQRQNDQLVKNEKALMEEKKQLTATIDEMKLRIDTLAQRISDLESDNRHKDLQIVSLQAQVLNINKVAITGEAKAVVVPEAN